MALWLWVGRRSALCPRVPSLAALRNFSAAWMQANSGGPTAGACATDHRDGCAMAVGYRRVVQSDAYAAAMLRHSYLCRLSTCAEPRLWCLLGPLRKAPAAR